MVRIVGYSWVGIYAEDFEAAIGFFTDKLGLPLEWRQEDADFAGLRLPSSQLLEVFGPRWADNHGWYDGAHPSTSPILGFEVEDGKSAREELMGRGAEVWSSSPKR
jgi:catechol 2,3-dioxygenase-like lactoylglutathione lyase family enzyme